MSKFSIDIQKPTIYYSNSVGNIKSDEYENQWQLIDIGSMHYENLLVIEIFFMNKGISHATTNKNVNKARLQRC